MTETDFNLQPTAQKVPVDEAYILIAPPQYDAYVAIPARLASLVLPELVTINKRYEGGVYVRTISSEDPTLTLINAENMRAIRVATQLEGRKQ